MEGADEHDVPRFDLETPNDEADKKLSKAASTMVIVCDVINASYFPAWLDP
jgi:hypothetical protein